MSAASIRALRPALLACFAALLQACASPDFDPKALAAQRAARKMVGMVVGYEKCPVGTVPVSYPAQLANWPRHLADRMHGGYMLGCLETIHRDAVTTGPHRAVLLAKDGARLVILDPYPPDRSKRTEPAPLSVTPTGGR